MRFNNVLITGGAGFIGSQLVRRILPLCNHIYVIDNLSTGNREAVPRTPKVTFIEDSVLNKPLLQAVMPKVDYIFHLACSNLVKSVQDMELDLKTNLYGGYLLLESAQKYCVNLRRFVYTSTSSIYSEAAMLPTPEDYYNIKLPYAASKFATEHYCAVFHHLHKLPTSVLRLSNAFGPGQSVTNPYCGVVARFFAAALSKEPLIIYGDGNQTRDFTFIDDCVDAIMLTAKSQAAIGQVYNVGTGRETSIAELAAFIIDLAKYDNWSIEYAPKRAVDIVQRRNINAEKIREELNWRANHSVIEGLRKTLSWLNEGEKT